MGLYLNLLTSCVILNLKFGTFFSKSRFIMEKKIDFTPTSTLQAETDSLCEQKKEDARVEIDRVAEKMLDKYEAAFLELAK